MNVYMKTVRGLLVLVLSIVALSVSAQADNRKGNINGILYQLTFNIPDNSSDKVSGEAAITFDLRTKQDVVLDFQGTPGSVTVYKANKKKAKKANVKVVNDQIIIPAKMFKAGTTNKIVIDFTSQEKALSHTGNVVYTQVQADEGRALFPCFDDAEMLAQYQTTINAPAGWKSVTVDMAEKMSPSSYMFVAGKFEEKTSDIDGRNLRVLYSEADPAKAAQVDQVFKEVAKSMKWMEGYTGIDNPYNKEFVIYRQETFEGRPA